MTKSGIENLISTNAANESSITAAELREILNALLDNDYFETTLSDSDASPDNVGGWPKGTTVAQIKNKGIVEIFNKMFFEGKQKVVSEEVTISEGADLQIQTDISDVELIRCQIFAPDGTEYVTRYADTISKTDSSFNLPSNFPAGTYRIFAFR